MVKRSPLMKETQELSLAFGKALREHRLAADLTQAKLSQIAVVGETYISEIESPRDRSRPHNLALESIAALATALGKKVTLEWHDIPPSTRRAKRG